MSSEDRRNLEAGVGAGTVVDIVLTPGEWAITSVLIERTKGGKSVWRTEDINPLISENSGNTSNPARVTSALDRKGVFMREEGRKTNRRRFVRVRDVRYFIEDRQVYPELLVDAPVEATKPARGRAPIVPADPSSSELYVLPPALFTAYCVAVEVSLQRGALFRRSDYAAPLEAAGVHENPSGALHDLEERGLVRRVSGTPRSRTDPLVFEIIPVYCQQAGTGVQYDPRPRAEEPHADEPAPPVRATSRGEIAAELARVNEQIAEANRPQEEWHTESLRLQGEAEAAQAEYERARLARDAANQTCITHTATRPEPADVSALIERRDLLQLVDGQYDKLVGVLVR